MLLHLDCALRNAVFFPVTVITICANLIMKYLTSLFNPNKSKVLPSETKKREDFEYQREMSKRDIEMKIKNAISRAHLLKDNYMFISEKGFKSRKAFFCNEGNGYFSQKIEKKPMDLMNPNMMFDGVKRNIVNAFYYLVIFVIGGFFFNGFILLKLPFTLTQKFRGMMQQGLNLPDVDVSYVSAISWCLILVFGLNSIIQHFDGGEDFSMMKQQEQMMKMPMNMFPMGMGQEQTYEPLFKPEKESINILPYFSTIEDSIDRLIEKYRN